MEKISRNQRIVAITKILLDNPNKVLNLNKFTEAFAVAKSTISEDILLVRDIFVKLGTGKVETISGASGGVRFIFDISAEEKTKFSLKLSDILRSKDRIIPGDFIYMTDIMYNPEIINKAGLILASAFNNQKIDYVVTVETKGVPLAYEVAKKLGKQLVIVRRDNRVTEGTTVSINYVTGSNKRIQTMSLSRKAIFNGSSCIFIDDFMKAGGTANGIKNLLNEYESNLVGIGILVDDRESSKKLIGEYVSIIQYKGIDENGSAIIEPSF